MRKFYALVLILLFVFAPISVYGEVELSAKSAVLIDFDTGKIIYGKNYNEKLPMASTTKIITAITAIEHGNQEDVVTVSANAASTEGSSVWLSPGEQLTLNDLLYALMLESGNDASVAIAEYVGGNVEGFAELMNETCRKAGAISTNCVTPSGLDDELHYTTAIDLARITRYAMRSETFRKIVSTYKTTIPWQGNEWDRTLVNHNKMLLNYPGADGVKTGYTKKSGRCLVSSAVKDDWRVIAVTLNASDDWNDHTKLLNYAFDNFRESYTLYESGAMLGEIAVQGYTFGKINYGLEEKISVRHIDDNLASYITLDIPEKIPAPVEKGEILGTADIYFDGNYYKTVNIIALESAVKNSKVYIFSENYKKLLKVLFYLVR